MTIHQDWESTEGTGIASVATGAPAWVHQISAHDTSAARNPMPWSKRVFDVGFSLLLLLPLSLIMVLVALLLLLVQGRPILYRARRMSAPGHSFTQYKFRTMRGDHQDFGATGAHKHWRITPLGGFLRRTRLDELPQLFNILKGDMSFVGPRPPLPEYVERFPMVYAQVLKSRPGATGLATLIYHRHEDKIMAACDSAEATESAYYRRCLPAKLKIDMIYQSQRSLGLDLWIIWRTLLVVFVRDVRPKRRRSGDATCQAGS